MRTNTKTLDHDLTPTFQRVCVCYAVAVLDAGISSIHLVHMYIDILLCVMV